MGPDTMSESSSLQKSTHILSHFFFDSNRGKYFFFARGTNTPPSATSIDFNVYHSQTALTTQNYTQYIKTSNNKRAIYAKLRGIIRDPCEMLTILYPMSYTS